MRALVLADSHFNDRERFAECVRLHEEIVEMARDLRPDVILHAGDLYERASTPTEREAVADFVQACASIAPVVVVRGNHDARHDIEHLRRLRAAHPIWALEDPQLVEVGGMAIAALPWPRKAAVLAHCESAGHAADTAADGLRAILRGLGNELEAAGKPSVLLSHAMVRGSKTSTGQQLVGCDFELGLEDLDLCRAHAYALGHIHMRQEWSIGNLPVFYPGSPRRSNIGEREEKGVSLLTWNGTYRQFKVEYIPTSAIPMVLCEADYYSETYSPESTAPAGLYFSDHSHEGPDECAVKGAEVRLRYNVSEGDRRDARRCAEYWIARALEAGAIDAQIEERVAVETRARAPELATAQTLVDQLRVFWESNGTTPDAETSARLTEKLKEIES